MLVDRYPEADVVARGPELAGQTDPVLVPLERRLDDEPRSQPVGGARAQRSRRTLDHRGLRRRPR